jgi:hypothetical protein
MVAAVLLKHTLLDLLSVLRFQNISTTPAAPLMICVGLLQEHSDVPDSDVGRFVFEDLAVANEASSSSIADVKQLGEGWPPASGRLLPP